MKRLICILGIVLSAPVAHAEDYPSKLIKVVSPFPPGGTTDIIAREVANTLTEKLGATAIVENKTGGSAIVGTNYVAKAAPDGYTLLIAGSAHGINNTLRKDVPYDGVKDFEPVALLFKLPHSLIVNPALPVKTVKEFIDYAKKNPKAVACGVTPNTSNALATELFTMQTKAPVNAIAYQGDAQIMRDLLGNHINCFNGITNQVLPYVANGKVVVLATTGTERLKVLPDVPTLIELGIKDYEAASWNGVFVPAGTPKEIVRKLESVLVDMAKDPAFIKRWEDIGAIVTPEGADGLRKLLDTEIARWKPVIAQMKPEDK
jgi:tripartite-type tricarboxylate transporter receptor subunit TctC